MKFQEGDTLKVTTVVDFSIFGRSYHVTQYLSLTKSEEIPLTPQDPTLSGDEILSMQSVSDYQKSCAESLSSEEKIAYYQIYNKISNY